jgi:tRNA(fMet)-specific endonuclease VapC
VIAKLSELMPILPLPKEAGEIYGTIRSTLERKGEIIGNNDLWIAAHALAAGMVVVTGNENEFGRVPGLVVENWTR